MGRKALSMARMQPFVPKWRIPRNCAGDPDDCCNCYGDGPTLGHPARSPASGSTHMPERRTRGTTLPDQDPSGSDEGQDALAKAGERDIEGRDRDLAADVRDREAEQRDREAEARDAAGDLDRTAGTARRVIVNRRQAKVPDLPRGALRLRTTAPRG